MADEPDRGEIETLRDALTRCVEQIRETVTKNDRMKSYLRHNINYHYNIRDSRIIINFSSLTFKVEHLLGRMRQQFVGGIDNLTTYKEKLNTMILELEQHTDELILGMRDSCIGYIKEVIQLIDKQIRRLHEAQRGRRKTRSRRTKIKKQTRRSRSGSRSRRN